MSEDNLESFFDWCVGNGSSDSFIKQLEKKIEDYNNNGKPEVPDARLFINPTLVKDKFANKNKYEFRGK